MLATASLATAPLAVAGPLEASPPNATTILERRLVVGDDGEGRWETRTRAPSFEARFELTKPSGVDAAFQLVVEPGSLDPTQLAKAGERIAASYAEPAKAVQSVASGPLPDAGRVEVEAAAARSDRPPVVARAKTKTRVAHRNHHGRVARNGFGFGGFFGGLFGSF